jgi:hypothetical protein
MNILYIARNRHQGEAKMREWLRRIVGELGAHSIARHWHDEIILRNGDRYFYMTEAQNIDRLRGLSIERLYIDELAELSKDAWEDILVRRFAEQEYRQMDNPHKHEKERNKHAKLQKHCDAYCPSDCYEPCAEQIRAKIQTSESRYSHIGRLPPDRLAGRIFQQRTPFESEWPTL